MITCAFCGKPLAWEGKVYRSDTCPHCGRDLHCCLQCRFYDEGSFNQCKETQAERVVDKEKANFCEYFVLKGGGSNSSHQGKDAEVKKALEDLFKKEG